MGDDMPDDVLEIPPTGGMPMHLRDFFTPWRNQFAKRAAAHLDVPAAGLECSGTACLVVILTTLCQMSGRRTVVVPAYTCPLVVFAVVHCGLRVRLCDLAVNGIGLDPAALRATCDEDTLAIIPTHLAGRVAPLDTVIAIAREFGAFVVEDAAQSFAARQNNMSIGLMGDAGFFSFAAGKGLSLYEGGLWIARDPAMRDAMMQTRARIVPQRPHVEALRCLQLAAYAALYRPRPLRWVYGVPLRLALRRNDVVSATGDIFSTRISMHRVGAWRRSIGCNELGRLSAFHGALKAQAERRIPLLARLEGVKIFSDAPGTQGVWPMLLLLMPTHAQRDAAMDCLWGSGLGVSRMFAHALPDYAYLRSFMEPTDTPNARDFAMRSMVISNSMWLDDVRFSKILKTLEDVLSR